MKATVVSPANIAFIKYWGQKNPEIFLPFHNTISMNLDSCFTRTTVEFLEELKEDDVEIAFSNNGYVRVESREGDKKALLFKHIERIRKLAGVPYKVKIRSKNNFPAEVGIASSASGFSALTYALAKAAGLNDLVQNKKELSKLTRLSGSASAARSIHDGFVELLIGEKHDDCFAVQLADTDHFDIADIVAVVTKGSKHVSSSEGHLLATTSPYFTTRLQEIPERIEVCRKAILEKDYSVFGRVMEKDARSMHHVMMTSNPPIFYWTPVTLHITQEVKKWREKGLEVYFTLDAGANVHVICKADDIESINEKLKQVPGVLYTITNKPGKGASEYEEHLF